MSGCHYPRGPYQTRWNVVGHTQWTSSTYRYRLTDDAVFTLAHHAERDRRRSQHHDLRGGEQILIVCGGPSRTCALVAGPPLRPKAPPLPAPPETEEQETSDVQRCKLREQGKFAGKSGAQRCKLRKRGKFSHRAEVHFIVNADTDMRTVARAYADGARLADAELRLLHSNGQILLPTQTVGSVRWPITVFCRACRRASRPDHTRACPSSPSRPPPPSSWGCSRCRPSAAGQSRRCARTVSIYLLMVHLAR